MPMGSNPTNSRSIPNQSMVTHETTPKSNKRARTIIASAVAGILLVIAGTFGVKQYQVNQTKEHLTTSVTRYQHAKEKQKLSDAKNVLSQRQSIKE